MIFKINHLFNIIFTLPLIYLIARGFQHLYLDVKKKEPKVDFDDLVKQKEQLLMLTLGTLPLNEICKTFAAYNEQSSPEQEKILQIFKGLQWGEGPFQREAIDLIKNKFGINCDLIMITNSFKFLLKHELLISKEKLPGFKDILSLTSLVALYKSLRGPDGQNSFANKKNIKVKSLISALNFQVGQGGQKELTPKEFEKGLVVLLKKNEDIIKELLLYTKVVEKLGVISPMTSKKDLSGALRIMGLKENSSKEEIKKRYRYLAMASHPDTLSDVNIPKDLLKQASENFNQINLAYKLLLEKIS